MKFDPTDQQLIQHLQGKIGVENSTPHPLLDRFITTLEGEDGICYTHPENLPGSYQNQNPSSYFMFNGLCSFFQVTRILGNQLVFSV